ncbi:endonuclease III [Caulobacter sp. S45]|uniref:endonuclease III n=1 Tax=Caulobacter sp. S45 TaxID=1641861 RepID=UPI001575C603|nr:endonuclease III [Caulobacter sp. S45]
MSAPTRSKSPSVTPGGKATRSVRARSPTRLSPRSKARITEIFARFQAAQPDPRPELDYISPYTFLVAVALSAQATDKSVNKATETLFPIAHTPEKMLELGVEGLEPYIKSIGLYRSKARNVIAAARILVEQYGGETPLRREALQALPGVGRKTASVVLNQLDVEPAIAVDTHVFRVSHRLDLSQASTPDAVERDLMARVPEPYRTRAHHWLILHGRYICVARKPKCPQCPVADLCPSRPLYMGA